MLRKTFTRVSGSFGLDLWRFRLGWLHYGSQILNMSFLNLYHQQAIIFLQLMPDQTEAIADPLQQQKSQEQLLEQLKQKEEQKKAKQQEQRKLEEEARAKRQEEIKKLEQALKGALSGVSKSSDNATMVYTKLTLAEKQLERVFPTILRFNQILHLDISANLLSDILVLTQFPNLVTLNLSKNQIKSLDAFTQETKLTKLQFLNLASNKVKSLSHITLTSLRKLNLSENEIDSVKDFKGHSNLAVLQLRKNKLKKLKGLSNMRSLNQLYVCQNQITDLRGLENLTSLVKLSLRNNKIKNIMNPFPFLPSLMHINLRQNQIGNLKQLVKLDQHIVSINIIANPVSDELGQNLKKEACWLLPHLVKINKSPITEEERIGFEKDRLEKAYQEQKEKLERQEEAKKLQDQQSKE